jgi:RNA polymerase sigma factor (sigma-70 family)
MPADTSSSVASAGRTAGPRSPALSAEEQALLEAVLAKDRKAAAEFVSRYASMGTSRAGSRLAQTSWRMSFRMFFSRRSRNSPRSQDSRRSSDGCWALPGTRLRTSIARQLREPDPLPDDADVPSAGSTVEPGLDELIDAARTQERTRQILERLPVAYSAALLWRYWEKRSIKEMAAQTGKTEKAIERLLARARTSFKRL